MSDTPFSVSMCVYGRDNPEHFRTAMFSVVQQSLVPTEIVLVVDGPIPVSIEAVIDEVREEYSSLYVLRLEQNKGHGEARRIGLAACTHDLVALMDADDISVPDRFATQMAIMSAHPEIDICGANIEEFIDTPSNVVGRRIVPQEDAAIKEYMKKRCPFNQVTVFFRKNKVQAAGGYIDWFCEEDYYLWLRMALNDCHFFNCQETLVQVRVGEEMYQRRGGWKYFASEARLQLYMLKKELISLPIFVDNVVKRFVVQVLLPNKLRSYVFQRFARSTEERHEKV